jgi:SAM-dependent methyltransferase
LTRAAEGCRLCGEPRLTDILSLGRLPLVNALPASAADAAQERRHPLRVGFCTSCALLQLMDDVPPEEMFDTYAYLSSISTTMTDHAARLVERTLRERRLGPSSFVVEIASNDGYLLQCYKKAGVPCLGIDPASNVAEIAERIRGIPTLVRYFDAALGRELARDGRRADIIHANNVLAHVPDPNALAAGIAALLKDDGRAIVEVPYVRDLVDNVEFDTIYHEHYSYFSLQALDRLARRNGLVVLDVERLSIHGGSLRVSLGLPGRAAAAGVAALLGDERQAGIPTVEFYRAFREKVDALLTRLRAEIGALRDQGKRIAAYGASAKGAVLLNALGLDPGSIEFVADLNPVKQGRLMPGVHVPVLPPEELMRRRPDYTLLLVWNIANEIVAQQDAYLRAGGHFIVPIPAVRVI